MVEDPNLAQHLAHFGINIAQMEKVHLNTKICATSVFVYCTHYQKNKMLIFRAKSDRKSSSFKF